MTSEPDHYTHGHHESVLRSHRWRTAQNSAGFLLTHLKPGDDLLDVGCGPGTISADLADMCTPGTVTGIDVASGVIATARALHGGEGHTNLTFAVEDVYGLSFEDSSFDVVYAHQVLQHLSDPVRALGEMRRVLRVGGLLAVRDADYAAFAWSPTNERLDRWREIYHAVTRANRAEADAGRYLPTWVRRAGFEALEVSSSNWTFHTPDERLWWGQLWADRMQQSDLATQALALGLATHAELEDIADAFVAWANDDDGVFIVVNVEVLARR
jgi:ubiquinone/menaquinone biosynthesis C-methylase UbiE